MHTLSIRALRARTPEITLQDNDEIDLPANLDQRNALPDDFLPEEAEDTDDPLDEEAEDMDDPLDDLPKAHTSQQAISNTTIIGPFKNELEVCLYMSQRPELINLTLNMVKINGNGSEIVIQEKSSKFSDKVNFNRSFDLIDLIYYLNILFVNTENRNLEYCNYI